MLKIFMKLTRESVHGWNSARLHLTADQEAASSRSSIKYSVMDKLNELDTLNVELFSHAIDNPDALREDKVSNQPNTDALLANAPDRDETFFKVPKIIE
jgi:aspartyl-tRNA(Asn)/glutamyl-tRNA(Gln) amidotransferase subunit C